MHVDAAAHTSAAHTASAAPVPVRPSIRLLVAPSAHMVRLRNLLATAPLAAVGKRSSAWSQPPWQCNNAMHKCCSLSVLEHIAIGDKRHLEGLCPRREHRQDGQAVSPFQVPARRARQGLSIFRFQSELFAYIYATTPLAVQPSSRAQHPRLLQKTYGTTHQLASSAILNWGFLLEPLLPCTWTKR